MVDTGSVGVMTQFTASLCSWLDLSDNGLVGSIPESIARIAVLQYVLKESRHLSCYRACTRCTIAVGRGLIDL